VVRRNVNGAVGRLRSIRHCEGFRVLKWKRIVKVKKKKILIPLFINPEKKLNKKKRKGVKEILFEFVFGSGFFFVFFVFLFLILFLIFLFS